MAVDKRFLRQQIIAQIERCTALGYAAGQHFLQHGKHAAASMQAQAEADARLIHLIEDYAAIGVATPPDNRTRPLTDSSQPWTPEHCKAYPRRAAEEIEWLRGQLIAHGVAMDVEGADHA